MLCKEASANMDHWEPLNKKPVSGKAHEVHAPPADPPVLARPIPPAARRLFAAPPRTPQTARARRSSAVCEGLLALLLTAHTPTRGGGADVCAPPVAPMQAADRRRLRTGPCCGRAHPRPATHPALSVTLRLSPTRRPRPRQADRPRPRHGWDQDQDLQIRNYVSCGLSR
jgi:hypothetical protein